jgi:membrane-bound lytic murein transglycosylase D
MSISARSQNKLAHFCPVFLLVAGLCVVSLSCGGRGSLAQPQVYEEQPDIASATATDTETQTPPETPFLSPVAVDSGEVSASSRADSSADRPSVSGKRSVSTKKHSSGYTLPQPSDEDQAVLYSTEAAIDDSASAVDDDIWRKFDLADEYYGMGVIANREASWEEAQYYFEKAVKILANLDIESDSVLTPEAVKYNRLLDNIVSDYRMTLRSLGRLEDDVSSSVMLERFTELAENLGRDTMRVYNGESGPVTYDIPIVMNDRVKKSIIYFQTVANQAFNRYLGRINKYTPMMKEIIRQYGLPEDLVYLSLVESGFNPHAYSWARAMGLWQFISSTGKLYGLERNWWLDERKDPVKSTHAACQFLKDLYQEFGSWELAMAAYNGGPQRVRNTIQSQKTSDFWKMRLKRQTMDYVPLIMAAAIIGKNPDKYGFTDIQYEDPVTWDEVEIDKCLELSVVADALGCTADELKELNPELLRKCTPPDATGYKLKVPAGTGSQFRMAYAGLPSPKETGWIKHTIRTGETIGTVAARYGVSAYAIMEANNLRRGSKIYAGKQLIVPVPLGREGAGQSDGQSREYAAKNSIYQVRSGDTIWDIARAFGTTVDALRRTNYIEAGSRIYVGQRLKIPTGARNLREKSTADSRTYARADEEAPQVSEAPTDTPPPDVSGAKSSSGKYLVQIGDTLWDIARRFGTTTAKLRALNGLNRSSRLHPGQILAVASSGDSSDFIIHLVEKGDTLARIAQSYRTTISKILAANNIDDPDQLQVGDKLKIYVK